MSEIKYAYQKLMAEHKLTVAELPEDAKIGINAIMNIEKAVKMAEKSGKKVSPDTIAKIKANDKWVVNEILDFVDKTDENEEEMPHEEEEVIEEIKETTEGEGEEEGEEEEGEEEVKTQPEVQDEALGIAIEQELAEMHSSGKVDWHSDEIKAKYKKTYNTLFDTYEDGGENGIETTNYKLIEKEEEVFTISKK